MMIVVFLSIFLTIISILLLLGATMLMVVCSNTLSYLLYILINPRPLEVLHINDVQWFGLIVSLIPPTPTTIVGLNSLILEMYVSKRPY